MLHQIKNLILDMDGVLWHGETPMPGLSDFFITLKRQGVGYILATNNATKTAAQYTEKLSRFGLQIPANLILTSAEATASYMSEKYHLGEEVFVIGERGLHDAVAAKGFRIVSKEEVASGHFVRLVVVGFNRYVSYDELAMGALLVNKGADFIGTNPDPSYPSELGSLPGAGALQAVIVTATGIHPTIIGKPGPIIFQEAIRRLKGTPANTAMVGDRLSTDIAGGKAAGIKTILLLSGISTRSDVTTSGITPDYIFEDISELTARFTEFSPLLFDKRP